MNVDTIRIVAGRQPAEPVLAAGADHRGGRRWWPSWLRMIVLPLLHRMTRKTASKLDDQIVGLVWPAVFRSIILRGRPHRRPGFRGVRKRLDVLMSQIVGTLMVIIWGRVLLGAGTLIFQKLSDNADRYAWIQPQTLPLYPVRLQGRGLRPAGLPAHGRLARST